MDNGVRHRSPRSPRSVRPRPHRWTRNGIRRRAGIKVEQNPRVRPLIQSRPRNAARRRHRPASRNLEIEALWICLCTIVVLRAVQRNNLVPDHVVARLQVARDRRRCREVVLDEVVRHPGACAAGSDEPSLRDLGPAQVRRCLGCAFSCRRGSACCCR